VSSAVSGDEPVRPGPSHCGQSAASAPAPLTMITKMCRCPRWPVIVGTTDNEAPPGNAEPRGPAIRLRSWPRIRLPAALRRWSSPPRRNPTCRLHIIASLLADCFQGWRRQTRRRRDNSSDYAESFSPAPRQYWSSSCSSNRNTPEATAVKVPLSGTANEPLHSFLVAS